MSNQREWADRFEAARQRKAVQSRQAEQGLSAINIRPFRIPEDVFKRLGGKESEREVTYTCSTCDETPKPNRFANGYTPGKCKCLRDKARMEQEQREQAEIWQRQEELKHARCAKCYSWLGPEWSDPGMDVYTFQSFDLSFQSEAMLTAIDFAGHRRGNLVLWSDRSWGTGKTHLAAAICNHLLGQNIPCLFTTAQNMFNAFGARIDEHQGYSDLLALAGGCALLVIDDLDKVHLTGYKQSIFFEVLDKRYKRHLPTVVTTNVTVEVTPFDVVGISDYIGRAAASRLADEGNGGLIVREMNGEDYRRRAR